MHQKPLNRRRFLSAVGIAAGAGLVAMTTGPAAAQSAQPLLRKNNPRAVALGYRENHQQVDTAAWPKKQPGQQCSTCQLFTPGENGSGQCSIFTGHRVQASGWCNAWLGD